MAHHKPLTAVLDFDPERLLRRGERTESGCLEWTGARRHGGYGCVHIKNETWVVTRVLWAILHGDPGELEVDHACNNPPCFEPSHLRAVDAYENLMAAHSMSTARLQILRTHCPLGHPYAGDNLIVRPSGARACRTCRRRQTSESMKRLRAKR